MKKKWITCILAAALVCQSSMPVMAVESGPAAGQRVGSALSRAEESSIKTYLSEETSFDAAAQELPEEDLEFFQDLGSGTITVSFKTVSTSLQALLALNGSDNAANYMSLYIMNGNRIGLEFRKTPAVNDHQYVDLPDVNLSNGKWHTITLTVSENQYYKIYLDKKLVYTNETDTTNFIKTMEWELSSVTLGGAKRINNGNNYLFSGSLKEVKFFNSAIPEEEILLDHNEAEEDEYAEGTVKTEEYGIFDMGDFDAFNYRIPALVTTAKGTLIAAADQRNTHWNDNGNIDTVIRRSMDHGKTWEDPIDVIDLKSQTYFSSIESSYTIDPTLLAEDENGKNPGRIWMLVDMFPECSGTWASQAGSGYVTVGDQQYLALYDTDNHLYTVRENGAVYDSNGQPTAYRVAQGIEMPFHEYGDLYQGDEYVGNIYLKSTQEGNDTAPLTVYITDHLILTYSDDDGLTWSEPRDLNPDIKESWMKFIGTGPGVGIQLQKGEYAGRLVFPIYYTNGNNKQSSANIYSDDGGVTWHRGESPNDGRTNSSGQVTDSQEMNGVDELTESQIVELNNGHLLQFMRNTGSGNGKVAVAASEDGGATWGEVSYTDATEVYCQLSVVHYPELIDGNECVILSNPGGSGRNNGTLRIGKIHEDDSIEWITSKMFCPNNYAYSCLTVMEDGTLGLLYEHYNTIKFTSFNVNYIQDPVKKLSPRITEVSYAVEKQDPSNADVLSGDTLHLTVTLDQNVYTEGAPTLRMNFNGKYRHASYVSGGNGNSQMQFSYVIQEGDEGAISFLGPKIVCDQENTVKNKAGLTASSGDLQVDLGVIGPDPTIINGDVPRELISATAGSSQSGEGPDRVLDGDNSTLWHTAWSGAPRENHWILLDLGQEYSVNGLRYLPRSSGGSNGIITKYRIEVSSDNETFTSVHEGSWANNSEWKNESFASVKARYVRLVSLESVSDQSLEFTSAAEIRIQAEEFWKEPDVIGTPENVKVENITESSAVLSWEAPTGRVEAAGYRVTYSAAGETEKEIEVNENTLKVILENLKADMSYEGNVTAIDEEGNESEPAAFTFRTSEVPAPKPADKQALATVLQEAKGYLTQTDIYEPESLKKLESVIAEAEALQKDGNADQNTVNAIAQKLAEAIKGLVKKQQTPAEETLKGLKLNKKKQLLGVKEKVKLKVTPMPEKARLGTLKWKSSNPKIASVSAKGVVTAKKKGKATITVTAANGLKATCTIRVKKAPKSVTIKAKKKVLKVKKTMQLKAAVNKGSAGKITFKSKNKKVATVTAKGKVTALKKGTVTIVAKTYNKKKATIKLTVK